MNRKKASVLFYSFFVLVILLLLLTSYNGDVMFSHKSGIYNSSFELSLKASLGLGKVYYTLDGKDPRKCGLEYQEPLIIDEFHDPKHRFDANVSGLELLGQQTYYPNNGVKLPKATVVRASCKDILGRWGDVKTATYVYENSEGENPIISIVVDEDELFGENGIYINGNDYDAAVANYEVDTQLSDYELLLKAIPLWGLANWSNEDRTVRCYVQEIFGIDQIDGWGNLKIFGGYSRIYPQKSLSVFFDETMSYIFDNGEYILETQGIKLRNGGSGGTNNFLNDYIIQNLSTGLYCDNVRQKNVKLFINGEYWGIYQLYEKLSKEQFCKKYNDIQSEDVVTIIKSGLIEEGSNSQFKAHRRLLDRINEVQTIDDSLWRDICLQIDLDSCIDCYLINMIFGNLDYINHNTYVWNFYDSLDGEWSKWHYALYDLDKTFDDDNIASVITLYSETDPLFSKLITRDEFKNRLAERAESIIATNLSKEKVDALFESIKKDVGDEVANYYKRFGPYELASLSDNQAKRSFFTYLDYCHRYIDYRRDYFCCILEEYLGMSVHNLDYDDYYLDFSKVPNKNYLKTRGVYLGEGERVWAENGAEISIVLKADGVIAIDFSKCRFREDTEITFNGRTIWEYKEGVEKLRRVIVQKEYINQESSNTLRFWTSKDIDYSNDKDPRQMCFQLSDILISRNVIFDDDKSFSITFSENGNSDEYGISDLFYEAEDEGRWGKDGAYIDFVLKGDKDLIIDVSQVYAKHMQVIFNGNQIWDSKEDSDPLVIVKKSLINKEDWNRLTFQTKGEITSSKERGISEDTRLLAFYFKCIDVKILNEEYLEQLIHNLDINDCLIDFSEMSNSTDIRMRGVYLGEGESVWAENGAEISIVLKADGVIAIDFSKCKLREDTEITFNGRTIWEYKEGVEKLRKVIVPEEYINQKGLNSIRFWTSKDIDYSNDADSRQMCFQLSDILISRNGIFDDDKSFSITFSENGNSDEYGISDLFYEAEDEGRWGKNGAYIDFVLKGDNDLIFDVSQVYANDMQVIFNGNQIWDSKEDSDPLVIVKKSLINKGDWNRLTFQSKDEIKSPKERGISEDTRLLAFYFKSLAVTVLEE